MKKILIIEDDPIVSHIYRSRFEKDGFEVQISGDGQAGFYQLYEWKPDALLLDLMLPKLNGIDLLRKIRAVREFEKMPIVVFTNAYVANMIHESFSAGASAVYNKSVVTPRQIIDVFVTLLSKKQESNQLISQADDAAFQKDLLRDFERVSQTSIIEMRKLLQELNKPDGASRTAEIEQLFRKVRSFSSTAAMAGLPCVAKLSAAVEALVKEMFEKPKTITPSTLRTTAHTIDFFPELSKPGVPVDLADNPPIEILVVDDELLSRRAIIYALEKAFLKAIAVEDENAALAQAMKTKFDLIFLDVQMPGMGGFELCDKLRLNGPNRTTPMIFVTGTADFQVRAQSTLRGACDVIAKPFMFIELTVKAVTFALRHRIEAHKQSKLAASAACAPALEKAALII